jgi:hypothetical protein
MAFGLDSSVFRRHAESIPAHGMNNVESTHRLVPGHHITDSVVANVSHVDSSRGVGKHFQEIIFGFAGIFGYIENPLIFPSPLPFGFDFTGIISGLHGSSRIPIYCFDSPLF